MRTKYGITLLIGIMANISSCSVQQGQLIEKPLSGFLVAANARSGCIDTFRLRVGQSLEGVDVAGSKEELLGQVVTSLPELEKNAIEAAAQATISLRPGGVEIERANDRNILAELSRRFAAANICESEQPEADLYVFIDQLNLYLLGRGIDTGTVFSANGNPTVGSDTQQQILLSLVIYVQAAKAQKV